LIVNCHDKDPNGLDEQLALSEKSWLLSSLVWLSSLSLTEPVRWLSRWIKSNGTILSQPQVMGSGLRPISTWAYFWTSRPLLLPTQSWNWTVTGQSLKINTKIIFVRSRCSLRADPLFPAYLAVDPGEEHGRVKSLTVLLRQEGRLLNYPIEIQFQNSLVISAAGVFHWPKQKSNVEKDNLRLDNKNINKNALSLCVVGDGCALDFTNEMDYYFQLNLFCSFVFTAF